MLMAQAAPAYGGAQSMQQFVSSIVPMVCIFFIMYFLLIRPQQQKQKKLNDMISGLQTGDAVITSGGIHGLVSNVKDGPTFSMKIADNVRIEVDKSAIVSVVKESKPEKA
jgi:preprotein translocase subunit YajC